MKKREVRFTKETRAGIEIDPSDKPYQQWRERVEFFILQDNDNFVDYSVLTEDDLVAVGKAIQFGLPINLVTEYWGRVARPKLAVIERFASEYVVQIILDPLIPTLTTMEYMPPELWVAKRKAALAIIFEANRRHNEMLKEQNKEQRLGWIELANQFMPTPLQIRILEEE